MTQLNTSSPSNRKGIVRMANGKLAAIGELTGAEIAAEMSTDQRTKVLASLGVKAGANVRSQSGRGLTRLQVVAHAVENDPKCKGKAHLALAMLADDDMAAVNGSGIVKLLQRVPSAAGNDTDAIVAEMRAHFGHYAQDEPKGANHGWATIHREMRDRRSTGSAWDDVIADMDRQ